jgi:ABC-type multidrug transport system fused ATPase/permease subunit
MMLLSFSKYKLNLTKGEMTILSVILSAVLLIIFLPILLAKPKQSIANYLLLAMAIAFILGASSLQYTRTDDEYITFRVVDNFVNGKGLIYNPDERYEAITNTGWSLILSVLPFAGLSLELGSRWLSLLAALLCLWGVSRLAENLGGKKAGIIAPFLILFIPFFHYWSTSGLETMAFCALCAWSLALATTAQKFPYYPVVAGVAVWLRPEAPLIFITCFLLNFGTVHKNERVKKSIFSSLIFLLFLTGLYLLRYLNYGSMQAPTAISKIPLGLSNVPDGISVLTSSLISSPILFLGLLVFIPFLGSRKLAILFLLSLCGIGYTVWLGFDTMKHERLLAPFIPGMIVLLASGLALWKVPLDFNRHAVAKRISLGFVAGLLIASPYLFAIGDAKAMSVGLDKAHRQVAEYINSHAAAEDAIAVQDAGIIGYYCHGKIIDSAGIFDPTIIAIHKAYGRVSNNSQQLPPDKLAEMNRKIADYILNEARPRYIILVYTISDDGELKPSKHNHNLGENKEFITGYTLEKNFYFTPVYILKLYGKNQK